MSLNTWSTIFGQHSQGGDDICLEVLTPDNMFGDPLDPASHPLEGMTVDEILLYAMSLKEEHPDYEMWFEFVEGPEQFGAMNWYELRGRKL